MRALVVLAALLPLVVCQLRPRRVGVAATGDQEAFEEPTGALDNSLNNVAGNGADGIEAGLKAFTDAMGSDPEAMLSQLADNPMLKSMMDANPEMAQLLSDPEAMAEKMQELMQLMQSDEGKNMMGKMMNEMKNVLTDPEKMKEGLKQFSSNPMLKNMADAMPELKQVLDDPDKMDETVQQATEMFSKLSSMGETGGGMEGLAEMLKGLGAGGEGGFNELLKNPELMAESMKQAQKMMEAMGGGEGASMADLLGQLSGGGGEDGDDLQARVRAQMASMMDGADEF